MSFKTSLLLPCFGLLWMSIAAMPIDFAEKVYSKTYFSNGNLKAEGWKTGSIKTDYWYYYHANGNVAAKGHYTNNEKQGYWYFYSEIGNVLKEGHYDTGIAEKWWIFYDIATGVEERIQFETNRKNGYSLIYVRKRLKKVEQYQDDLKIGEWTSLWAFKKDNPDISL